jgi:methylase of polypeptide subunit release factors
MYEVNEDSVFFAEFLKSYLSKLPEKSRKKIKYLDIGTGSGILSQTASKFLKKENILATDIDKEAIEYVNSKGFQTIHSNLFNPIKNNAKFKEHQLINSKHLVRAENNSNKSELTLDSKFDLITFNAPYLPEDRLDKQKDTSGGKNGDETPLKFLTQAKKHLNKSGKIFLLISSITPQNKINKFKPKLVAKKHIFFEDLLILRIG